MPAPLHPWRHKLAALIESGDYKKAVQFLGDAADEARRELLFIEQAAEDITWLEQLDAEFASVVKKYRVDRRTGVRNAKTPPGNRTGRPRKVVDISSLQPGSLRQMAAQAGVNPSTIHRRLKEMGERDA